MDDIIVIDKNGLDIDGENYFNLSFKTLPNELGYWKDNGSFLLKNYADE